MKPRSCMGSYQRLHTAPRPEALPSGAYRCAWCGREIRACTNVGTVLRKHNKPQTPAQQLTRGQRRMLRAAAAYYRERVPSSAPDGHPARGWSPCPQIGDLKILAGLCKRGMMTVIDEAIGFVPALWPRYIAITDAGLAAVDELDAARLARKEAP